MKVKINNRNVLEGTAVELATALQNSVKGMCRKASALEFIDKGQSGIFYGSPFGRGGNPNGCLKATVEFLL